MQERPSHQQIVHNSKGVGMVEVIIASGLVVTLAIAVSMAVSGSFKLSSLLGKKNQCTSRADSIMEAFSTIDNRTVVHNFVPSTTTGVAPSGLPNHRTPLAYFTAGSTVYGNHQDLESTATHLLQMYNQYRAAICTNAGTGITLTAAMIPGNDGANLLQGLTSASIRIETDDCNALLTASPSNPISTTIILTLSLPDPQGQPLECETQSSFSYARDTNPPGINLNPANMTATDSATNPLVPTTWAPITTPTFCGNGVADLVTVSVPVESTEPGSMFECSQDGAVFSYCDGFSALMLWPAGAAPAARIVAQGGVPQADNVGTQANIIFPNLAEGRYRFFVRSVDSGGNRSAPSAAIEFIVDLRRPSWNALSLVASGAPTQVVDTPANRPDGSTFAIDNHPAAAPMSGLFQCDYAGAPQFTAQMDSNLGNEICSGVTSSVVAGNSGRVAPNAAAPTANPWDPAQPNASCTMTVPGAPAWSAGVVTFSAIARDVCNMAAPLIPGGGTYSQDINWTIDNEPVTHTHRPIGEAFLAAAPNSFVSAFDSNGPNFELQHNRAATFASQISYYYPTVGGPAVQLFSTQTGTLATPPGTLGWAAGSGSCYYSQGYCSKAFGPCGQSAESDAVPATTPRPARFAVGARLGQSCAQVPCDAGLSCPKGGASAGVCKDLNTTGWKCTNHNDCGSNNCVGFTPGPIYTHNSGTCSDVTRYCTDHGDCVSVDGVGRCEVGFCRVANENPLGNYFSNTPACQNLATTCDSQVWVNPACSCNPALQNACPADPPQADSCGALVCSGTNEAACTDGSVITSLAVVGVDNGGTWKGAGPQTLNGGGAFGVPLPGNSYIVQCIVDTAEPAVNDPRWRDCTQSDWPESPVYPADPLIQYWVKVTDSRNDWEVESGWFKLDRTNPSFATAPMIAAGTCGATDKPSLDPNLTFTMQGDDTHSETTIELLYQPTGFGLQPIATCNNTSMSQNDCVSMSGTTSAKADPDAANDAVTVRVSDRAGNYVDQAVPIAVAVRNGMTQTILDSVGAGGVGAWSTSGASAANCSNARYQGNMTTTFSGGNTWNWHPTLTANPHQVLGTPATTLPANTWPNGVKSDVRLGYDGQRTVLDRFVDSCGNQGQDITTTMWLDWIPPHEFHFSASFRIFPTVGYIITVTAADSLPGVATSAPSGISTVWIDCNGMTASGAGQASVFVGSAAVTYTCHADAIDNAGNRTALHGGCNFGPTDTTWEYTPPIRAALLCPVADSYYSCDTPAGCPAGTRDTCDMHNLGEIGLGYVKRGACGDDCPGTRPCTTDCSDVCVGSFGTTCDGTPCSGTKTVAECAGPPPACMGSCPGNLCPWQFQTNGCAAPDTKTCPTLTWSDLEETCVGRDLCQGEQLPQSPYGCNITCTGTQPHMCKDIDTGELMPCEQWAESNHNFVWSQIYTPSGRECSLPPINGNIRCGGPQYADMCFNCGWDLVGGSCEYNCIPNGNPMCYF